jgi:serine/threonine protein kinase
MILFPLTPLPSSQDIKKAVNQAQLTYDIVNKQWEAFCLVARLLFHRRLVPSQEAADALREKDAQDPNPQANLQAPPKEESGIRNEEPKRVFNPRKLQLLKQADTAYIYQTRAPDRSQCCVKRTPHSSADEIATNIRECYYLRAAQHPNVPRFIAAYESASEKELWVRFIGKMNSDSLSLPTQLCTEFLKGANLEELLEALSEHKTIKLQEKHVAYIAAELITLLTWLHDTKHIVHR